MNRLAAVIAALGLSVSVSAQSPVVHAFDELQGPLPYLSVLTPHFLSLYESDDQRDISRAEFAAPWERAHRRVDPRLSGPDFVRALAAMLTIEMLFLADVNHDGQLTFNEVVRSQFFHDGLAIDHAGLTHEVVFAKSTTQRVASRDHLWDASHDLFQDTRHPVTFPVWHRRVLRVFDSLDHDADGLLTGRDHPFVSYPDSSSRAKEDDADLRGDARKAYQRPFFLRRPFLERWLAQTGGRLSQRTFVGLFERAFSEFGLRALTIAHAGSFMHVVRTKLLFVLDANGDQMLQREEIPPAIWAQTPRGIGPPRQTAHRSISEYLRTAPFLTADVNGDGRVSSSEFASAAVASFQEWDADGDGVLTMSDLAACSGTH